MRAKQTARTMQQTTYSISELAEMANVSPRALRHYEKMGLITPDRAQNGYRCYDEACAKRLSSIIAMRSCGMALGEIRDLLSGNTPLPQALVSHLEDLQKKQEQLNREIAQTQKAMERLERINTMKAEQAFEELKRESVDTFEAKYGQEARERYGDRAIDEANARMLDMGQDEWNAKERLEKAVLAQLKDAFAAGNPESDAARKLVSMHRKWIGMHWGCEPKWSTYLALVEGYACDARFVAYYDKPCGEGATDFLIEAAKAAAPK